MWGMLRTLTDTFGVQFTILDGGPSTLTTQNFLPSDTTLNVESTLGFPESGKLWINDRLHRFTGITDTSFTGVTTDDGLERTASYGVKTEINVYQPSCPPV
jgi:hypothetical protein